MLEPTVIIEADAVANPPAEPTAFRAVTKREWPLDDVSGGVLESVLLPAGTYELERIPAPGSDAGRWLRVKGTTLGWPEHRWMDWCNPSYGRFQIEVAPIKISEENCRARIEALLDNEDTIPSVVEESPLNDDLKPHDEITVRCEAPSEEITVLCEPPPAARPRALSWSGLRFLLF